MPNEILGQSNLSPQARYLWIELWSYCNGGRDEGERNRAYPSQETLAERLGITARRVRKHIRELRRNGLLKVEQTKVGLNNDYFLYSPQLSPNDTKTQSGGKVRPPREEKYVLPANLANNEGKGNRGTKISPNKTNRNKTNTFTTEEPSSSQDFELFGSVTTSQLKDKRTPNYNVNELIARLQQTALSAGVVFEANKVDAGKLRGQMADARKELGGAGELTEFFEWYFEDVSRLRRFKRAPNKFKMHKLLDELANYKTDKMERQKRNVKSLRQQIWIESNSGEKLDFDFSELEKKNEAQLVHILAELKGEETPVKT